jgi:two-component system alkaline phosphatase synthesis response regulator PhoP
MMTVNEYKVLIVDDEDDILEFVSYNLKKEGFRVFTASNGAEAMKIAKEHLPHLVILDVMMPQVDGIEICRDMRQIPSLNNTIITFLTARSETYSVIAGLEAGADDYILKPIKPRVLVSKVNALLRRHAESMPKPSTFQVGGLKIDAERYTVYLNDALMVFPRKEFEILSLLASKPNKVFTREEIYSRIWAGEIIAGDRTIDVHIRKIREKLNNDTIKTIKGVGYKYENAE